MKKIAKKQLVFLLLPGFAPDHLPVLTMRDRLRREGYDSFAVAFWGTNEPVVFEDLTIDYCREKISGLIKAARQRYRHVVGIGISLGGALLLDYAKSGRGLDCVVSIGTPFKLKKRMRINLGFRFYPLMRWLWRLRERGGEKRLLPIGAGRAVYDFLQNDFRRGLENIRTPVLLLQSKKDKITDYRFAEEAIEYIGGRKRRLIFLNGTDHAVEYNAPLILRLLADFLRVKRK